MVLSNKKLKQKLRGTLAESLAAKESTKQEAKTQPKLLKELLGSATHKPRLSKREKRRIAPSSQRSSSVEGIIGDDDTQKEKSKENGDLEVLNDKSEKKKKNKKRKREDGEKENGVEDSKEDKPTETKKRNKQKKKKKKKNKKTKKTNKETKPESVENPEAKEEAVELIASQENVDVDVANKVYVGGIPYYSTEDDIRSFFDSCGSITEVDSMTFPESGKFRGIAMITFKMEAAAKRALALDGADMGGLFLKIQPYKAARVQKPSDFCPQMVEGYNRVYIGNLSWDITEDELRKLFSDCKISSFRFGEDKTNGEFRGYAHVDFSDSLSLNIALKLDQKVVCGRPVRIRCAVPMKRPENHSRSGTTDKNTENDKISSSGGKKKRRTCYECGIPGHLSSACPKKQAVDSAKSSAD